MIDLFLVFVDRNFFIQHSFSIDFWITTRMWVEHSKLSNQALDQMQWTLALTFTTPFSNVPADKLHPQFLATIFGEKMRLICGFYGIYTANRFYVTLSLYIKLIDHSMHPHVVRTYSCFCSCCNNTLTSNVIYHWRDT